MLNWPIAIAFPAANRFLGGRFWQSQFTQCVFCLVEALVHLQPIGPNKRANEPREWLKVVLHQRLVPGFDQGGLDAHGLF